VNLEAAVVIRAQKVMYAKDSLRYSDKSVAEINMQIFVMSIKALAELRKLIARL